MNDLIRLNLVSRAKSSALAEARTNQTVREFRTGKEKVTVHVTRTGDNGTGLLVMAHLLLRFSILASGSQCPADNRMIAG